MRRTPAFVLALFLSATALTGTAQVPSPIGNKPEAMGFKNYGQYVAATHVSENLHISLDELRKSMVDDDVSLGKSIEKLRPDLSRQTINAELKKAQAAAKKAETRNGRLKPIDEIPVRLSN